ncbi:3-methyl-2-oxobutanoate hydroxymethyltransferase [Salana multivorans]|uniref:3-methyl-2-oxobutanoate hydroxymethyltransferase n=1 Tax=Salana multivorans TaxID=120377 RepID=A0A3N2D1V4_9MICO|nr:3-methyl-2-oxobutanoate hydroxymethyltransferase [Salana multivorans]ROR93749.1 3-methyl-2-oxobutanoate hydroxymethyltransferase [Salana multivorans]
MPAPQESTPVPTQPKRYRVPHLRASKEAGRPITMLTAYDAVTARIFDAAGVDSLLVGDSIGNNMLGYPSTLPVTVDQMVVATRAVAGAAARALVVADLPFGSYEASAAQAHATAVRLMKEGGAGAVKLEGGQHMVEQVRLLSTTGIPVVGHLGLTPQSENVFGGMKVQGRGEAAAQKLLADALALEAAGAVAIVLEMVPGPLATRVTKELAIPTIGIGAGVECDGQVLVWTDMAGMADWAPKFSRAFGQVGAALSAAAGDYVGAVRERIFPGPEHTFDE